MGDQGRQVCRVWAEISEGKEVCETWVIVAPNEVRVMNGEKESASTTGSDRLRRFRRDRSNQPKRPKAGVTPPMM